MLTNIQVLQIVEYSCKDLIKKKICKFLILGWKCFIFYIQEPFRKISFGAVKLQTMYMYLGPMRLTCMSFSLYEICPEIRQMHTMAHKTAMENVNNLGLTLFKVNKMMIKINKHNQP